MDLAFLEESLWRRTNLEVVATEVDSGCWGGEGGTGFDIFYYTVFNFFVVFAGGGCPVGRVGEGEG